MQNREKHAYLSQYKYVLQDIKALLEEYERIKTIATHITQTITPTPGGSGNDSKLERCAIEMAEISAKLEKRINSMTDTKDEIEAKIAAVKGKRYQQVLRYRYISGMTNAQIAELTDKSDRQISRIMRKALNEVK